jgi:hypothetical protein
MTSSIGNMNSIVINKKDFKKYEDISKSINVSEQNNINTFNTNSAVNYPRKASKIFLEPIGSNSKHIQNKKMEVSFKATVEFTDDNGNQKIQINPNINVHNQNINKSKKKHLEKIVESDNNEFEYYNDDY